MESGLGETALIWIKLVYILVRVYIRVRVVYNITSVRGLSHILSKYCFTALKTLAELSRFI